jgi:hypothetical protein
MLGRTHTRSTTTIDSKNSLYAHMHSIEHLMGAFRKSPLNSNLNHESSSLLIRRLKNHTGSSICNNPHKPPTKFHTKFTPFQEPKEGSQRQSVPVTAPARETELMRDSTKGSKKIHELETSVWLLANFFLQPTQGAGHWSRVETGRCTSEQCAPF